MQIPEKLKQRLEKLGISEDIYKQRTRKCALSKKSLNLEHVPWYEHAYLIDEKIERSSETASYTSSKKDVYIFDPVSIVPCIALDPQKTDCILDMCAAPGTKTFIISFLTDNEAHITANDINRFRARRLKSTVDRFSISAEVLNVSGRKLQGSFNKIILDAPCSGEGMINKKEKAFANWSENRIKLLAKKQKKLVKHAFEMLEKGGTLVYSTCTFSPEENEGVVDFLLKKHDNADTDKIEVGIKHTSGITEWNKSKYDQRVSRCFRIYPQHNGTGGFFVAKIRKN